MADNCPFCRIMDGTYPGVFVHRDDLCTAFLDLRPVNPGHILIVPNAHIDHFSDIPDATAAHMMVVAQKLSRQLHEKLEPKPERVGMVVAGYGVAHAHLHVIPMYGAHDVTSAAYAGLDDGKIIFDANLAAISPQEEREKIAAALKG